MEVEKEVLQSNEGTPNAESISEELHLKCQQEVEKSINQFQSNLLQPKIEAKIKMLKDELDVWKRFPEDNKDKINIAEFQLDLLEDELKTLKGLT